MSTLVSVSLWPAMAAVAPWPRSRSIVRAIRFILILSLARCFIKLAMYKTHVRHYSYSPPTTDIAATSATSTTRATVLVDDASAVRCAAAHVSRCIATEGRLCSGICGAGGSTPSCISGSGASGGGGGSTPSCISGSGATGGGRGSAGGGGGGTVSTDGGSCIPFISDGSEYDTDTVGMRTFQSKALSGRCGAAPRPGITISTPGAGGGGGSTPSCISGIGASGGGGGSGFADGAEAEQLRSASQRAVNSDITVTTSTSVDVVLAVCFTAMVAR